LFILGIYFMSFQKLLKNKAVVLFAVGILVTCLFTGVSLVTQKPDKNNTKKEFLISSLQPNKDYTFGKNQLGKINFLSLPSTDKNLKIAEININRSGKEYAGYDFQTSLKNGSFGYNL
jgi:hypothetical protein